VRSAAALVLAAAVAGALLCGCAPVIVAAGVGGVALVATDRRTTGMPVDDEPLELKVSNQAGTQDGESIRLKVTSSDGTVLLTGEVPDQDAWAGVGNIAKTTERVQSVPNEPVVAPPSSLSMRSNDAYITAKVKSRMIEANKFPPNAVKVVTERSVVYLMGMVDRDEDHAAGEITATNSSVVRVVKPFELRS
jgi:osmotically-inducible protein OsmY